MAFSMRVAIAVAAAVVATAGVSWEMQRWSLHARKAAIERATREVIAGSDAVGRVLFARRTLELLERRHRYPLDVDLRLEAAAAMRLVGQKNEAEREYRAALQVSDRPEIHVALGDLLLEQGRIEEALDHYAYAVRFSRRYLSSIRAHRQEVLQRVDRPEGRPARVP